MMMLRSTTSRLIALVAIHAMLSLATTSHAHAQLRSGRASIAFMENRGEVIDDGGHPHPEISYIAGDNGVNLFLRRDGIGYVFTSCVANAKSDRSMPFDAGTLAGDTMSIYRMDMELVGASPDAEIIPYDTLSSYCNFYLGASPNGITHVRRFGRLLYRNVYEKIDMLIYSTPSGVKYDFIIRPGGRVSDIRIRYRGADSIISDLNGSLRVVNPLGYVTEGTPYSVEETAYPQALAVQGLQGSGLRDEGEPVLTRYRLRDDIITFDVARHDAARVLVIDPVLAWSTFLGGGNPFGSVNNQSSSIAADGNGSVFVGGFTTSAIFPTTVGAYRRTLLGGTDAFVTKFNAGGDTLWSTYYGGSLDDIVTGVGTDRGGNVVIGGYTNSSFDFPLLSAAQPAYGGGLDDGFLVKFDGNGTRQWSTYYGGSSADYIRGVAIDAGGNVIFAGTTSSPNLPTPGAFQGVLRGTTDVLIAKMSSAGVTTWSTYYGGTASQDGRAVAVDSSGNVFVTGFTNSVNFPLAGRAVQPTMGGVQDAFVAKFTSSGDTVWSTYLGGTGLEAGYGIAADASGNAFAIGITASTNFPITSTAFQNRSAGGNDLYVTKFSSIGDTLWSTYAGGSRPDFGSCVAADGAGNAIVGGYSQSLDFPVTADAYRATWSGVLDGVILKLSSATGDTLWSTYFGGNDGDDLLGVTTDPASNIYITGYTASTANFPITNGAVQQTRSTSFADAFVAKFGCQFVPSIARSGTVNFCQGDSVVLTAEPGASYVWSNGATSRSITVKASGKFAVTITDAGGCVGTSDTIPVRVSSAAVPSIVTNKGTLICSGDSVRLTATAGYRHYLWSTSASDTLPTLMIKGAGTYTLTVTDSNGCQATKDITINTRPRPSPTITARGALILCEGDSVTLEVPAGYASYRWLNGATGRSITVSQTGTYSVTVVDTNGCVGISDFVIVIVRKKPVAVITPLGPTTFCRGDSVTLTATSRMASYLWSNGSTSQSIRVGESGVYRVTVTDSNGCSATSADMAVQVNDRPKPTIAPSDSVTLCGGDSTILVASDGYAAYLWSNGATTRGITVRTAGSYSVTVSDGMGCSGTSAPVVVRVLAAPSLDLSGPNSVCPDRDATYSVSAVAGATYDWTVTGGSITAGTGTNAITVHWGAVGSGSVHLHASLSSTGCSRDSMFAVSIGSTLAPTITASRPLRLCDGDSVRLTAASGYNSYRWSTGDTTQSIVVRDSGSYSVSVGDAGGCSGTSAPVHVTREAPPKPVIPVNATLQFCEGDSVRINAPPGYLSYLWSNGVQGRAIVLRQSGSYFVTVTDSAGCMGSSDPVVVTANPLPRPVVSGPNSICTDRDARFEVAATPGHSYTWSLSQGVIVSGAGTASITARLPAEGADTIIVTEVNPATGCSGTARYPVTIDSVLHPAIAGAADICLGDTITLAAPSGYDTYLWSTGDTTQTIRVLTPGLYSVEVAQSGGCHGHSDDWAVAAAPPPAPIITPGGLVTLCAGDSVRLDAGAGFASYRWSTGDSTQTIVVRTAGRYSVAVTNANGCRGIAPDVTVDVRQAPASPAIAQSGDTLIATEAASYQWLLDGSPIAGGTAREYRIVKEGSYMVEIHDSNGCVARSAPFEPSGTAIAEIATTQLQAAPGEQITLPLILTSSIYLDRAGASTFTAMLRFNGSLLIPTGATPRGSIKNGERIIPITGVRPSGVSEGTLMQLEFIAALGDTDVTSITIDTISWNGAAVSSILTPGTFTLVGICRNGGTRLVNAEGNLALKANRPNPTSGMTAIEYEVVEQGRTRLEVRDLLGRPVALLLDDEIAPGRYVINYDASALATGTYIYMLETPTAKLSRMMVVEK